MDRQLVNEAQLARMLALSRSTLRKLRSTGAGPRFIRVGDRSVRYLLDDIESWLESRRGLGVTCSD